MSSLCSLFTKLSSFFSSPAGLWAIKINNIVKLSQAFSERIRICQTYSVHRKEGGNQSGGAECFKMHDK